MKDPFRQGYEDLRTDCHVLTDRLSDDDYERYLRGRQFAESLMKMDLRLPYWPAGEMHPPKTVRKNVVQMQKREWREAKLAKLRRI